MKKFQMYAKTERNLAARIKATQNTMDVIDHPALALQHQLQTLGQKAASSLIHAPIEKPAVFVRHVEEHAAALIQPTALERKAEVRERELGQVEVRELAMVRKVQAENSALRREVSKDTAVNSRTQEELWNERVVIIEAPPAGQCNNPLQLRGRIPGAKCMDLWYQFAQASGARQDGGTTPSATFWRGATRRNATY